MKLLVFIIGMMSLPISAFAAKVATVCHNCNASQMQLAAGTVSNPKDTINVLDFTSNTIRTFRKFVEREPKDGEPSSIRVIPVTTSQEDLQRFSQIQSALTDFKNQVESAQVPPVVLENVWDLPKRSFVANDLEDYITSRLWVGNITIDAVKNIARQLGLLEGELSQYWVTVADGGKIRISLRVLGGSIIEILEVRDSNNNTIPFVAEDVGSYRFAGGSNINAAMGAFSRLGFIVKLREGRATIIDCPDAISCKPKQEN